MVVDIPKVGTVDFPDTMSQDEIQKAAARQYDIAKQTPLPLNPLEKAIEAGAGKPGGAPLPSYRESVPAEMNPEKQAVVPILENAVVAPLKAAGTVVGKAGEAMEEIGSEFLSGSGIYPAAQPGVSLAPRSSLDTQTGTLPAINRVTSSFFTPGMLAAPFMMGGIGSTGAKVLAGGFGVGAVANVPEAIQSYAAAKTAAEKRDAATSGILDMAMAGLIAKGFAKKGAPNASTIRGPETVSGNEVRARVGEEAPLRQQGEAAGTQAGGQAQAPQAGQARTVLTDEEMAHIERGGADVGVPVEVTDRATSENEPFARQISTIDRKTGSILVRPAMLKRWLATVPEKQRDLATKSLMWEERLHLANTDAEATDYASKLSPLEKRIAERRYMGPKEKPGQMSDLDLAHEALRYRQQQLMRMTPREVAEAALKERWTLHALDAVDAVIRNTREIFGESADPTVKAMIDRMQQNIGVAKGVIGAEPSAQQKQFKYDELTQPEKVEYSWLHQQAMNARAAHEKLPNDTTADTLIDAELALRDFEGKRAPASSAEPSGRMKKGKETAYKNVEEEPFLLPGMETMTAKGVPGAETVEQGARSTVSDYPQAPRTTAAELEAHAGGLIAPVVQAGEVPRFKDFVKAMQHKQEGLQPGQLKEMWEKSVFDYLQKAPGDELSKLAQNKKMFGKESFQGKQRVADAPPPEIEKLLTASAKLRITGQFPEGQSMAVALKKAELADRIQAKRRTQYAVGETKRSTYAQRQKLISDLAYRLVGPALEETDLHRKTVTPDDLRYGGGDKISSVQDFRPEDEQNPQVLGEQLVDKWRRSDSDPVSWTKRLTALMDRNTGKVWLMSTFKDGRRGPVIYDPLVDEHNELSAVLKRYRVLSSYLLDEPVQDFHQSFDSLRDFNKRFADDARDQYRAVTSYEPPPSTTPTEGIEGTEGLEGEGGHLQGLFRAQVEAVAGSGRGAVQEGQYTPISDTEATAWQTYVDEQLGGEPQTPEDIWTVLKDLEEGQRALEKTTTVERRKLPEVERFQGKRLGDRLTMRFEGANAGAISALRKIAKMVQREFPKLSKYELMDKLAQRLYEDKNLEASVAQSKAPFSPKTIPFPRAEGESPTAKELTTLRSKSPTYDPNVKLPKGQPPEPHPLYKETGRLYQPEPGHEPSARMKRVQEEIQEDYNNLIGRVTRWFTNADTDRELRETRDGMDRNSEGRAASSQRAIIETSEEAPKGFEKMTMMEKFRARRDQVKMGLIRRRAARAVLSAIEIPEAPTITAKGHPPELPPNASPQLRRFVEDWVKRYGRPPEKEEMAPIVNPANFTKFMEAINVAEHRADEQMKNPKTRRAGRARKEAAIRLREEVQYAMDNWQTDPVLQRTVEAIRNELDDHFEWMKAMGSQVNEKPNYFPNIYKAEFVGPEGEGFGGNRLLGTQFWQSKRLNNYYEAISKGNFIPASDDPADIVSHHVLNTSRAMNNRAWLFSLTGIDTARGPAAMPAKLVPLKWVKTAEGRQELVKFRWDSPKAGYHLVQVGEQTKPVAIHGDFLPAVEALLERSAVKGSWPVAKALLQFQNQIRHGAILVADTYHPGRAIQLAASMGFGKRGGWTGGESALIYRDAAELNRAVELGHISKAAARWASQTIDTGIPEVHNRMQLLKYWESRGLNAKRFSDALYKDVVKQMRLPGMPIGEAIYKFVGPFNRWLFDRFLPGLMADGFVDNFEKMRKANPEMDPHIIGRDVLRDMNTRYGTLNRQGMFRNRTARDIGNLIFMAPAWQEGLIRSEFNTASRILRSPFKLMSYAAAELGAPKTARVLDTLSGRAGRPQLGALGTGMIKGLGAYFVLTQVLNYISRGHSTFQNEEEGHKLDAWMPLPSGDKDHGIWISPMSVFAEITHDITRIYQTRKDPWDTITQIGENKLGPFGRFAVVLASGINPRTREHITSPLNRLGVAATQMAPVPISVGPLAREAGHAIAPGLVRPNEPGVLARQMLASGAGIKTEVAQSPVQQMQRLAAEYAKSHGFQSDQTKLELTDEPSYSRLRHAISVGDEAGARKIYRGLLSQNKTDGQILHAMNIWARRPFTGSNKAESQFIGDMNDKQREAYYKAQEQRYQMLQAFEDWLGRQSD